MRRLLVGLLAALLLAVSVGGSFHRHAAQADDAACAVCAAGAQARSAPSSSPVLAVVRACVAVVVSADRSAAAAPTLAVPARAPPSVA